MPHTGSTAFPPDPVTISINRPTIVASSLARSMKRSYRGGCRRLVVRAAAALQQPRPRDHREHEREPPPSERVLEVRDGVAIGNPARHWQLARDRWRVPLHAL